MDTALGFIVNSLVGVPSAVCARESAAMMVDLPPPVCPTTMVVCRVSMVSYSCTTLSTCSPAPVSTCSPMAASSASTWSLRLG